MAVYKLFATKDASIYSDFPLLNSGLDAMNEVRNIQSTEPGTVKTITTYTVWNTEGALWNSNPLEWDISSFTTSTNSSVVSRFLIGFEQSEIDYVLDNIVKDNNWDAHMVSYVATAQGVIQNTVLELWPVAYNWLNGTGQYADVPEIQNGVSWKKIDLQTSKYGFWPTASFDTYTTASFHPQEPGGGVWYTGSSNPNLNFYATQSFNIKTKKDLDIKVTDTVKAWYSGSISNNGLIAKFDESAEWDGSRQNAPDIRFYSTDTHTIYPPALEIRWDDSNYITGSLSVINQEDIFLSLDENPGIFYLDSINRFRINCRPKYPVRTYQTGSWYTQNYLLPSSSYYAIKDLDTNEYVVDFDKQYTKISADSKSSYFTVYMNGLEPERYYQVLVKTEINNEVIVYKDRNFQFKVNND